MSMNRHTSFGREKPPNTESPETVGKQLFRHAWDYAQRIDQATRSVRHTADLFKPELLSLRKKLRDKCEQVLLVPSSYRRKAEELLWKKAIYEVIQKCKQHKQALDGVGPLYTAYKGHLSAASSYYSDLLHKLEAQYGVTVAGLDGSQLEDLELDSGDIQWLKVACHRCLLYLGDLARYQVDVGGSPYTAVAFYHHAISLDPTNGVPFNQLAVLARDKNECLDAVYYYQRSLTSPHSFEGSETNLHKIFDKNGETLDALLTKAEHTREPNIREFTRRILLARFLHLQQAFAPGKKSGIKEDLGRLCGKVIDHLEECLTYDLQLFQDTSLERVRGALSENTSEDEEGRVVVTDGLACLPSDVLLKLTALSILPSHSLRLQGSAHTPAATAFALSVFSQLLHYSYQRLRHLLVCALKLHDDDTSALKSNSDITGADRNLESLIDRGKSMVELALSKLIQEETSHQDSATLHVQQEGRERQSDLSNKRDQLQAGEGADNSKPPQEQESKKHQRKKKLYKIMNLRRRRRSNQDLSSSDEEGSESEDVTDGKKCGGRSSSEDSLSTLSESMEEDDFDLMESLSESSYSSASDSEAAVSSRHPEPSTPLDTNLAPEDARSSPKQKVAGGKRQIVLAANFNPPTLNQEKPPKTPPQHTATSQKPIGAPVIPAVSAIAGDDTTLFHQLVEKTRLQSAVHMVCKVVAEENYLLVLKVFADWLQSYPVVVATCGQSSSMMWSRLATLLNFLPSEKDIHNAGLLVGDSVATSPPQSVALVEDMALRGFAPLVRSQESLTFSTTTPSKLKQTSARICSLHKFGQYVSNAKTVPALQWDESEEQYVGPAQKAQRTARLATSTQKQEDEQAQMNRSKLMRAMAHQLLQSEVASLAETSAKREAAFFTPYLVPDAKTLCGSLHIAKKLLKTEKFVFIIAKSVIETLDGMKKGKENYTAREAIKFLERELQGGNRFIRAQKSNETLHPERRKPPKQEVHIWHFNSLVECALYFNQTYTERGSSKAVVTLLLDKTIIRLLDSPEQEARQPQLANIVHHAQQNGVEVETMLGFYTQWQSQSAAVKK